ncbi:MAG: tetratricopeptide repeat protein [Pseudomonadota bacterium]
MSRLARIALPCVALLALALALYGGSLGYPLVFDDKRLVGALAAMRDAGFSLERRGITFGSFGWIYGAFGPDWRWQRLANVLLHGAVAVALFLFLRRLLAVVPGSPSGRAEPWYAFAGAALFALHPAAVYGVAYLTQRSILLATLFSLASLWLFLEGLLRRRWPWFAAAAFTYLLAVGSKEHSVMLPAVAAALAILVRGWPPRPMANLALPFVLYAAIALAAVFQARGLLGGVYESLGPAALKQAAESTGAAPRQPYALSVINQGYLFFRYILTWLLPWPGWMSIDLRPPFPAQLLSWPQSAGFLAWLAWPVAAAALLLRGGRPGLAGFAMLAPWLLALTEFVTVRVQEPFVLYRSYLWMCLAPAALPALLARLGLRLALPLLAAAALALAPAFADRLRTFSSELALWEDAVRKLSDPSAPFTDRAYRNRGVAYFQAGRDPEALRDFDRAIELHPGTPEGWISRGTLYMRAAQSARARADFDRALALDPHNGEVLARRCIVLMRLERLDEALADCTRAVELGPADAAAHVVLGMVRALRGEAALAERSYLRALELDASDGSAHYQYGVLLRGTGREEEAKRQFAAACKARVAAACRALP